MQLNMKVNKQLQSLNTYQNNDSKQVYEKHLQNLKCWKQKDQQTILTSLQYFLKYSYQSQAQMQSIKQQILIFHKDICKINDKNIHDKEMIQVNQIYFQKVLEMKAKLKKIQKHRYHLSENKQKKISLEKLIKQQNKKKNHVSPDIFVHQSLFDNQKQQYHQNQLKQIYRSFVCYYPESHNEQELNKKLIQFLKQLYISFKKKYFYLKKKQYFLFQIDKLCQKLRKQKFVQIKRKMLKGQISIQQIVVNKISVFESHIVKEKNESEMLKILKESQIKENSIQNDSINKEDNKDQTIQQQDKQKYKMEEHQ